MKLLRERFPGLTSDCSVRNGLSPNDPEPPDVSMRFHASGPMISTSASRDFTAPAIATSRPGWQNCLGRDDARVISCHLGGSSSLTAIAGGKSVMTTMGMTPQTGLPQNNRVGDFDPFALPLIIQRTGMSLDEVLSHLASHGGLLGLSNNSGDIRDLESAAANGRREVTTGTRRVCRGNSPSPRRNDGGPRRCRCNRLHRRDWREGICTSVPRYAENSRSWHRHGRSGQRVDPRRVDVPRRSQPNPAVGGSDQRRIDRRPSKRRSARERIAA